MSSMRISDDTTARHMDEIDRELMDPGSWDWDSAVLMPPVKNPGLRLMLRLEREDVRVLSAGARAANMKLSDYIKQAALETARRTNS